MRREERLNKLMLERDEERARSDAAGAAPRRQEKIALDEEDEKLLLDVGRKARRQRERHATS